MKERNLAIVLAAGSGSRMQSEEKKQFIKIYGKPVLWYSLDAFSRCAQIDDIIVTAPADALDFVENDLVKACGFEKVRAVVAGGKERYHSVFNALCAADARGVSYACALIHDSARPMLGQNLILEALEGARTYEACVLGVPVKDTIKVTDEAGYVKSTPDRRTLWSIQTPQAFSYPLVKRAYEALIKEEQAGELRQNITDDAMVVETFGAHAVRVLMGDYCNIKLTTPEDLELAEKFLKKQLTFPV